MSWGLLHSHRIFPCQYIYTYPTDWIIILKERNERKEALLINEIRQNERLLEKRIYIDNNRIL